MESYRALFRQAEREDPLFLGSSEAREALERSGLPHPELSHIWGLADADGDGQLSFGEFACAMHLTGGRLAGLALPPELPPELRPLLDAPAEVAASAPVVAANAKACPDLAPRTSMRRLRTVARVVPRSPPPQCDWLLKTIMVYFVVILTWITVVILELRHAPKPEFLEGPVPLHNPRCATSVIILYI